MPSTLERGHATRLRLLDAAAQLITQLGWGSVTTRKVADRAGVRFGVVHYHFSSVTDLLIDASLRSCGAAIDQAREELTSAPDVPTGLRRVLAALDFTGPHDPVTLLLAEAYLAANREQRLREQLGVLLAGFRRAVADWLRDHGTPEAEATAAVVTATFDGLLLHRALSSSPRADTLIGPLMRLIPKEDETV